MVPSRLAALMSAIVRVVVAARPTAPPFTSPPGRQRQHLTRPLYRRAASSCSPTTAAGGAEAGESAGMSGPSDGAAHPHVPPPPGVSALYAPVPVGPVTACSPRHLSQLEFSCLGLYGILSCDVASNICPGPAWRWPGAACSSRGRPAASGRPRPCGSRSSAAASSSAPGGSTASRQGLQILLLLATS